MITPKQREMLRKGAIAVACLCCFGLGMGGRSAQRKYRNHWTPKARMLLFIQAQAGDERVAKLIMRYADEYALDPLAFASIIWQESKFNPGASNPRPAEYMDAGKLDRGLGGLSEKQALFVLRNYLHWEKEYRRVKVTPSKLYDPDLNLAITGANLRRLLDQHTSCHDIWDAYKFHNSGDKGKGSLQNVTAVKDQFHDYVDDLKEFDWRKAR